MRHALWLVPLLLTAGCTDSPVGSPPQTQPIETARVLECGIGFLTSMDGGELEAKVAKLWLDFPAGRVLRADELADGRVFRNPYTLREATLTEAMKRGLAEKGLPAEWAVTRRFRHQRREKIVLYDEAWARGLIVTLTADATELAAEGGELAGFHCAWVAPETAPAHEQLAPADPIPQPEGCADGSIEQTFGGDMVGCGGTVTYPRRDTLCAPGWRVCSAAEWAARFQDRPPTLNYWTKDTLKYSGSDGQCEVSVTFGSDCSPPDSPMRVCAGTQDPLGNRCNWTGCGFQTQANQYFGGCNGNLTAGAVCCR